MREGTGVSRLLPHTVVFVASMGVMIVELVASRLVAKYLGSSLFTWTGVIGVVLGGISLGNWVGGRLADRWQARSLAPILLLAASALTVLIIALDVVVGRLTWELPSEGMTVGLLLQTLLLVAILFLLPSTALGTISPVMAKFALEQAVGVGKTVGGLYAAGSLGSIGGTFLAGYLLIPALGLSTNVLVVSIVLAALALLLGGRRLLSGLRIASGLWILALASLLLGGAPGALAAAISHGDEQGRTVLYEKDSPYSYIRVMDSPSGDGIERTLRLDALVHNKTDPARPDSLLYEYERIFEALTRQTVERMARAADLPAMDKARFSTLTLGGGGFTMPGYLERHYPDARHTVVEIDPDVVAAAHRYFGLPQDSRLEIAISDARRWVRSAQGRSWDIVYCDAFNAFSVPAHLTTLEFTELVARALSSDVMYLVNCIDVLDSGRFLNAYLNTVESVFPTVAVYVDPTFRPYQRATFVVAAKRSSDAFPEVLRDPAGTVVGQTLSPTQIAELRARNGKLILTDDRAPVDTLMAPVFLRAVR